MRTSPDTASWRTPAVLMIATAALAALLTWLPSVTPTSEPLPAPPGVPGVAVLSDDACEREDDGRTTPQVRILRPGRVTSEQVVGCPAAFDGLQVTYVGELVGDLLRRHGGAWVLANDDDYALRRGPLPTHGEFSGTNAGLTLWLDERHLGALTGLGRPEQRGDVVLVEATVRRGDPADGGGLTLRVDELSVLAPAAASPAPVPVAQLFVGGLLGLAAAAAASLRRRARR